MRSAASAVEVQGFIYVLGGYDPDARNNEDYDSHGSDRLDVVERFDPRINTWEMVSITASRNYIITQSVAGHSDDHPEVARYVRQVLLSRRVQDTTSQHR